MPTQKPKPQQGIQSIEVGNILLVVLGDSTTALSLKDLAARAQMSASKAHRYLVSYARLGLVEQEPDTGRYGLGEFALRLGLAAIGRLNPVTAAAPVIGELATQIKQTVAVAIWGNRGPTIVRWEGVDSPVSATLRIGSVMPLSRSATGLLFLAYLKKDTWSALLKADLSANAKLNLFPQTAAELTPVLADIRERGYSQTNQFIPGITGIAAPVTGADNTLSLALITLGYSVVFEADERNIRAALLQSAANLSKRLGHRSSEPPPAPTSG